MKIFAISDLHLSTAVEKPMDIFGDGWQNHFQKISADWQSKVTDDDLILLGGDISWGLTLDEAAPDYALINQLAGQKFVVKGNHDYYWNSLSKMRARFEGFSFIQNNAYRIEKNNQLECINIDNTTATNSSTTHQKIEGVVITGTRGWTIANDDSDEETTKIYNRELQRLQLALDYAKGIRKENDLLIAMLHYPPFDADYADTKVTQLLEEYHVNYAIYGHLHGKNVRVTPRFKKNGIEYILTSCDLVDNKVIEVCEF